MGGGVSKEDLAKRHVVIVGGGYGGMELAITLLKWDIPFTLIDTKDFFHHNVGALRGAVYTGISKTQLKPVVFVLQNPINSRLYQKDHDTL